MNREASNQTPMPPSPRILVAEDDPNDVLLLKLAFHKANLKVPLLIARDGEEVLALLENEANHGDHRDYAELDLLLLDLRMPKMDGFAVLEWLRWRPEVRPRSVVVFTASDNPDDLRRARFLGADSYLVKPQAPGELVRVAEALREYLAELPKGRQFTPPSPDSRLQASPPAAHL